MIKPKCFICKKEQQEYGALLWSSPNKKDLCKKTHICRKCYKNILSIIKSLRKLIGKEWDIIYRGNSFIGIHYFYTDKHQKRDCKAFKDRTFYEILERLARSVNGKPEDC